MSSDRGKGTWNNTCTSLINQWRADYALDRIWSNTSDRVDLYTATLSFAYRKREITSDHQGARLFSSAHYPVPPEIASAVTMMSVEVDHIVRANGVIVLRRFIW